MAKKHVGICRLTGDVGALVESHIIPKALTRPQRPGLPFTQGGNHTRPVRRWKSWTDTRIATRKGEDILRDLDTWAISAMRAHKLVWSGFSDDEPLPDNETFDDQGRGGRIIDGIDGRRFRLFLLRLLWRAAASQIPEMSEIVIPNTDLQELGRLIVAGDPGPIDFYPACIIQLSTRGPAHNRTPIASLKHLPLNGFDQPSVEVPIFRFYFEGLIVHFHRHASDDGLTSKLGPLIVGQEGRLFLPTIPFRVSFQAENLLRAINAAETEYPEIVSRLSVEVARAPM